MSERRWEDVSGGFAAAIEQYQRAHGRDPATTAVQSSVRTNTELVPRRAENLLAVARLLTGRESITDARVLEAGCGFGSLAGYLAWNEEVHSLVAVDSRADYIAAAKASCESLDVGARLKFRTADMRDLDGIEDCSVDLAVLNNAFVYLTTRGDMKRTLRSLHRVLVPGGHAVFYHASKWQLRDPFSGDPVVHLLPAPVASAVCFVTGWKNNHKRIRLVSAGQMRRGLRRAGFVDTVTGVLERGELVPVGAFRGHRFYGAAGRRPDDSR